MSKNKDRHCGWVLTFLGWHSYNYKLFCHGGATKWLFHTCCGWSGWHFIPTCTFLIFKVVNFDSFVVFPCGDRAKSIRNMVQYDQTDHDFTYINNITNIIRVRVRGCVCVWCTFQYHVYVAMCKYTSIVCSYNCLCAS